ncbi:putative sodium-type flagellar protein MotY, partial [Vibrio parahaemolyticus V-223/04]
WVKHAMSA